jgi:hypothetical protein
MNHAHNSLEPVNFKSEAVTHKFVSPCFSHKILVLCTHELLDAVQPPETHSVTHVFICSFCPQSTILGYTLLNLFTAVICVSQYSPNCIHNLDTKVISHKYKHEYEYKYKYKYVSFDLQNFVSKTSILV